jgi:hypothetical protein
MNPLLAPALPLTYQLQSAALECKASAHDALRQKQPPPEVRFGFK